MVDNTKSIIVARAISSIDDSAAVAQRTDIAFIDNTNACMAGGITDGAIDGTAIFQCINVTLIVNTNTSIAEIIDIGDDTVNGPSVVQRIAAICICILKTIYSGALWIVQQGDRARAGVSNVDLASG